MEYIGTIFVALICFWLGYVLGKIVELRKDYPMPEDTVLFNKGVEEGRRLEKEDNALYGESYYNAINNKINKEETRTPCHPDKWETPLG